MRRPAWRPTLGDRLRYRLRPRVVSGAAWGVLFLGSIACTSAALRGATLWLFVWPVLHVIAATRIGYPGVRV